MAAYTDFCCRSGGSNLNAGTLTGNTTEPGTAASFTYTAGSWVQSTGVFTLASGDPSSDGVAVGDFASVYPDAATVSPFIGRITAVDSTTITVSATAMAGAEPVNGTLDTSIKVGGAWKGPNGAEGFPLDFIENTLTNSSGNSPRLNFKNDATYAITARIVSTATNDGYIVLQGYTTSYTDGGRAIIDGGTSGTYYELWGSSADAWSVVDMIFQNQGASGSDQYIVDKTATRCTFKRCVFREMTQGARLGNTAIECEFYNSDGTGLKYTNGSTTIRCISHDNGGIGFECTNCNLLTIIGCISFSNGSHGFEFGTGGLIRIPFFHNESYNNTGDGLRLRKGTGGPEIYIHNCNFVKNGGYGFNCINSAGDFDLLGYMANCGFGAGTEANTSGTTNNIGDDFELVDNLNYPSNINPWVDPANGDFSINLAEAINAGTGNYTELDTGLSAPNTVGFPDIGSAQHLESGGGGETSHVFAG